MTWFLFGALSGLFEFLKDIGSKKALKGCDEYLVAWAQIVFGFPITLAVFFFEGLPHLTLSILPVLLAQVSLLSLGLILYARAIKLSDLSLSVPIIMFSPLFLLVTAPLMLGEVTPRTGFAGVLLIVVGGYILNIQTRHIGPLEPFKALLRANGPRIMLAVAIIFSITANLDKMGLKHLSALHWLALMQLGIALVLSIFVMIKVKNVSSVITSNFRQLLVIGLCNGLMIVSYMLGLKTGLVAYIVSLKRLSVLLTVCYGAMIYKEQGMKERLLGSLVMVVGVILIAFG